MIEISLESPVRKHGAFVFLDGFAASFDSPKDVSRGIRWHGMFVETRFIAFNN
jgi:hypothetical protein